MSSSPTYSGRKVILDYSLLTAVSRNTLILKALHGTLPPMKAHTANALLLVGKPSPRYCSSWRKNIASYFLIESLFSAISVGGKIL